MMALRVSVVANLLFECHLLPSVSGPMLPAIQRHYHVRFLHLASRNLLEGL